MAEFMADADQVPSYGEEGERKKRRSELAAFLRHRREQLRPKDVGLKVSGRRHVKGLRREEVAQLSGIGTSWYTLLEQGRVETISDRALHRIADALRLSGVEREHLFALARFAGPLENEWAPNSLHYLIDRTATGPAFLMTARYDLIHWNRLAAELFGFDDFESEQPNLLERMMLDSRMQQIFPEWEQTVINMIAVFRANYGRLGDGSYDEFVDRMRVASPRFKELWESRIVDVEPETMCVVNHPAYGIITMYLHAFTPVASRNYLVMFFTPVVSTTL